MKVSKECMKLLKFVSDADEAPIVVCNTEHIVMYMNPASIELYHTDITGKNIKICHNQESCKKIDQVLDWFSKSKSNNKVHTYYNAQENKDVYIIALRNENGELAGYYEKHEYRTRDGEGFYIMGE